ncbi:MAG: crossover junction endodeoxyribonuclease RuvC [Erythrobacter sp.]|uniref:crossover junction endodeoxyribonuclease RuvC n=1 Tax=Erythrobacter sp. TaxID=1042 RepID=UPI0025E30611|nr:crossover junction endodeoxyribonuclease RuvC [Erythrobacter sp.]MCM0000366.1 crossover junction endodeoxyribonuclease RuvC [Erythrobacter sp.]
MLILGLDPSLSSTGWGVIRAASARLSHVANGQIRTDPGAPMAERLATLQAALAEVIAQHRPARAAAEEIFVNKNPQSTLKLAQARGAVLAACGAAGLTVNEHAARLVKKAVTGTGGAEKAQVAAMVRVLLPGVAIAGSDAADALAVAIADAHLGPRH